MLRTGRPCQPVPSRAACWKQVSDCGGHTRIRDQGCACLLTLHVAGRATGDCAITGTGLPVELDSTETGAGDGARQSAGSSCERAETAADRDEPCWSSMPDSSLTAISRASAGQPAIFRLLMPGPAVATFAARLPVADRERDLRRRTASGSPSIRMGRFARRDVRSTAALTCVFWWWRGRRANRAGRGWAG